LSAVRSNWPTRGHFKLTYLGGRLFSVLMFLFSSFVS
jgi:hypothetical protein